MGSPTTEAGRALLLRLRERGSGDNAPFEVAIARIEEAAARDALAAFACSGRRFILIADDLLANLGTRTERGDRITAEWGEPTRGGWYEPVFTAHADDNLVRDALDRVRAAVEAIEPRDFETPGPSGWFYDGFDEAKDAVLAILEPNIEETQLDGTAYRVKP